MGARFTQLDAHALDIADAEPLADEVVDVDAARHHVAARGARLEHDAVLALHRLDCLGGDERERAARRGVSVEEVAVALEATTGERADRLHRLRQRAVLRGDEDALDVA